MNAEPGLRGATAATKFQQVADDWLEDVDGEIKIARPSPRLVGCIGDQKGAEPHQRALFIKKACPTPIVDGRNSQ